MFKKVCFYTMPFPKMQSYREMIDLAVEYGMEAVEGFCQYEFAEPDIEKAREVRAYADSKNIKFSCFSLFCNLVGEDSREQIERLKKYAEVCAVLGSPYIHHTIANELDEPDNVIPFSEELFKKGIEAVREVYDHAEKFGVRAIYEDQGYLFNGVENFGRFLSEVDRNVGVVADFGNIYHVEEEIDDFIRHTKDRICHVHIKDVVLSENQLGGGLHTSKLNFMHEAVLGEGCVKFKEGMKLLREMGYNGYYSLEYGAPEDDSPIIEKTIRMIAEAI